MDDCHLVVQSLKEDVQHYVAQMERTKELEKKLTSVKSSSSVQVSPLKEDEPKKVVRTVISRKKKSWSLLFILSVHNYEAQQILSYLTNCFGGMVPSREMLQDDGLRTVLLSDTSHVCCDKEMDD